LSFNKSEKYDQETKNGEDFPSKEDMLTEGRANEKGVFYKFCDWFLPCVAGKQQWKKSIMSTRISEFLTRSDEAIVLTILDNCWERWHSIAKYPKDTSRWMQTKYTNDGRGKGAGRNQGWNVEGMKQFNCFMKKVKQDREGKESHCHEEQYREHCIDNTEKCGGNDYIDDNLDFEVENEIPTTAV
jgi:hypothetical protein